MQIISSISNILIKLCPYKGAKIENECMHRNFALQASQQAQHIFVMMFASLQIKSSSS